MKKYKLYNQAPLPFVGQKRYWRKEIENAIKKCADDTIFIDLFGGSGLVCNFIKHYKPNARVIWNDFDNYEQRLKNIDKTNKLLDKIFDVVDDLRTKEAISDVRKKKILEIIKKERGYVDYITISANLLFSGKQEKDFEGFAQHSLYNRVVLTPYERGTYLEGVERVSMDWKKLFSKYKGNKKAVFIADPPYMTTNTKQYHKGEFWSLTNHLEILDVLNYNCLYFNSEKSSVVELLDFINQRCGSNKKVKYTMIKKTLPINYKLRNTEYIINTIK